MATPIQYGYVTGRTLTFTARQTDGSLRGSVNQSFTETSTEFYTAAPDVDLVASDTVIIKDSVAGVIAQGQYQPEVSDSEVEAKVDLIDTNVGTLITNQGKVNNTIQTVELPEGSDKARIYI